MGNDVVTVNPLRELRSLIILKFFLIIVASLAYIRTIYVHREKESSLLESRNHFDLPLGLPRLARHSHCVPCRRCESQSRRCPRAVRTWPGCRCLSSRTTDLPQISPARCVLRTLFFPPRHEGKT